MVMFKLDKRYSGGIESNKQNCRILKNVAYAVLLGTVVIIKFFQYPSGCLDFDGSAAVWPLLGPA